MANEVATASADDAALGRMHDQQLFLKAGESCACSTPTENAPAHMQLRAVLRSLSTQHSILSTQYSTLGTHSVLST